MELIQSWWKVDHLLRLTYHWCFNLWQLQLHPLIQSWWKVDHLLRLMYHLYRVDERLFICWGWCFIDISICDSYSFTQLYKVDNGWSFVEVEGSLICLFVTATTSPTYTGLMKGWSFVEVDVSLMFQFVTATASLSHTKLMKGWPFVEVGACAVGLCAAGEVASWSRTCSCGGQAPPSSWDCDSEQGGCLAGEHRLAEPAAAPVGGIVTMILVHQDQDQPFIKSKLTGVVTSVTNRPSHRSFF